MKKSINIFTIFILSLICCSGCATNQETASNNSLSGMHDFNEERQASETKGNAMENNSNENVSLKIITDEKNITTAANEIEISIINYSDSALLTGEMYKIQWLNKDEWEEIPIQTSFEDIGYIIAPGSEKTFICALDKLQSQGQYRILKSYKVQNTSTDYSVEYNLSADFQVQKE